MDFGLHFQIHWRQLGLREIFDLIILDVMMPELDGLRLCSMLKVELKDVPILFLTAKCEPDEIKGFERGADDYLTKPFDNRELVARTKAILARTIKRQVGHFRKTGGRSNYPRS